MTIAKVTLGSADFEMKARIRNHILILDEPLDNGGQNKGPAPTECVCMALASCTVATLKMYMNRKQWKPDSLSVEVVLEKSPEGKNTFKRSIHITGSFNDEQKDRLLHIANACPVHKILSQGNVVETTVSNPPHPPRDNS